MSESKKCVVISGYYGFDNLGDEAILEELCREVRELNPGARICVLSQNPQATAKKFNVESIDRWDITQILSLLSQAHLFISGGGGLFQDTSSIKSVVYYAFLFLLARIKRVPIFVYAQGIGPLKSRFSRFLTQASFSLADCISVRDSASAKMLADWNLPSHLTADPVWALKSENENELSDTASGAKMKIGLSLRQSEVLTSEWLIDFVSALEEKLPPDSIIVPLILHESQDRALIENVGSQLKLKLENPDIQASDLPSRWLAAIGSLDMVIAMRLHAVIMALKSGVPVLGLSYDPKVKSVIIEFEQPYLDVSLPGLCDRKSMQSGLHNLVQNTHSLSQKAKRTSDDKEKSARQNKQLLAKFLK